jgi:hypothetical protein
MITSIKEKPILFSTPMVKAILEGRKSQTRRVIPMLSKSETWSKYAEWEKLAKMHPLRDRCLEVCPYGKSGDRLWVRETFCEAYAIGGEDENGNPINIIYKASYDKHPNDCFNWKPSIFMFREYSRINLEVTEVRVRRLQDINTERHDDVLAEGWPFTEFDITANENPVKAFIRIWDSINVKRGYPWSSNPWVWAISFKKV